MTSEPVILHASAIAVQGRGLLIRGASGSGKSSLALQLLALGAILVSDDRTVVAAREGGLHLSAPQTIAGLIEARGIGILQAEFAARGALLHAVVDLDIAEESRLPPHRETILMNRVVPLLHNCASPSFPAALLQYMKAGRRN